MVVTTSVVVTLLSVFVNPPVVAQLLKAGYLVVGKAVVPVLSGVVASMVISVDGDLEVELLEEMALMKELDDSGLDLTLQ